MRAVGAAAAEEVLAARRASGAKFGMPSSNTITQLLMTYAAYDSRAQRHLQIRQIMPHYIKAPGRLVMMPRPSVYYYKGRRPLLIPRDMRPREKMLNWPPLRK